MQDLAADYLDHFSVTFGEGAGVRLDGDAPKDLMELVRLVDDLFGPGNEAALFEALSIASESELPHLAEVDEKVCPADLYFVVLDFLGTRVYATDGGN
ncbi:MAG: hypothetical protein ACLGQW_05365 [Acidobacteriota bacterium]